MHNSCCVIAYHELNYSIVFGSICAKNREILKPLNIAFFSRKPPFFFRARDVSQEMVIVLDLIVCSNEILLK